MNEGMSVWMFGMGILVGRKVMGKLAGSFIKGRVWGTGECVTNNFDSQ